MSLTEGGRGAPCRRPLDSKLRHMHSVQIEWTVPELRACLFFASCTAWMCRGLAGVAARHHPRRPHTVTLKQSAHSSCMDQREYFSIARAETRGMASDACANSLFLSPSGWMHPGGQVQPVRHLFEPSAARGALCTVRVGLGPAQLLAPPERCPAPSAVAACVVKAPERRDVWRRRYRGDG